MYESLSYILLANLLLTIAAIINLQWQLNKLAGHLPMDKSVKKETVEELLDLLDDAIERNKVVYDCEARGGYISNRLIALLKTCAKHSKIGKCEKLYFPSEYLDDLIISSCGIPTEPIDGLNNGEYLDKHFFKDCCCTTGKSSLVLLKCEKGSLLGCY